MEAIHLPVHDMAMPHVSTSEPCEVRLHDRFEGLLDLVRIQRVLVSLKQLEQALVGGPVRCIHGIARQDIVKRRALQQISIDPRRYVR